jgi:DNA repair protein RadD
MKIVIIDPVVCAVSKTDFHKIKHLFSYKAVFWQQTPRGKRRRTYQKKFTPPKELKHKASKQFKGTIGLFYRGFLYRVNRWAREQGLEVSIEGQYIAPAPTRKPKVKGIKLRGKQLEQITAANKRKRGLIQSATGTGKTVVQAGIASTHPKLKVLILSHTTDIVEQTYEKFIEYGLTDVCKVYGSDPLTNRIVVSTRQSWVKRAAEHRDEFDIIMIDEVHHVQKFLSEYEHILTNCSAPIRLGFTATIPKDDEAMITLEGLLGPVINQYDVNDAVNDGILAKPKVKIVKAPDLYIPKRTRYQDVYKQGIVENIERNRLIAQLVRDNTATGQSVLCMITQIKQGKEIQTILANEFNLDVPFVHGLTQKEERRLVKKALNRKKVKAVISSSVWTEGVDIPSLDVLIVGALGKSETRTLQFVGRGLRKTDDKRQMLIIDIFDNSHPYLISHFGERISLYSEKGWL